MKEPVAYDSAYPGSMVERKEGYYVSREDVPNLLVTLAENHSRLLRQIEDLQAALEQERIDAQAMREAGMALYSVHEPEGRFQPSHYKSILHNFRRAFQVPLDENGRVDGKYYNVTAANAELAAAVLEWAKAYPTSSDERKTFIKLAERIQGVS